MQSPAFVAFGGIAGHLLRPESYRTALAGRDRRLLFHRQKTILKARPRAHVARGFLTNSLLVPAQFFDPTQNP